MAFELIKVSELPELTTPSDPNVIPIQDGDYLKRISFENLKEAVTGDVADDLAAEVTAREGAVSDEATARGNADTAILADLASPYSASATYAVGDYCTKDGVLKRCNTAITTAEAWNSAHWDDAKLGGDVSTLRSALTSMKPVEYTSKSEILSYPDVDWTGATDGRLNSDGTIASSYTGYSVSDFIPLDGVKKIFRSNIATKYNLEAYALYDENKNMISGTYHARTTSYDFTTYLNYTYVVFYDISAQGAKYIRITKDKGVAYIYTEEVASGYNYSLVGNIESTNITSMSNDVASLNDIKGKMNLDMLNAKSFILFRSDRENYYTNTLINQNSGEVLTGAGYSAYCTSDYIEVEAQAKYATGFGYSFACYNADKTLLSYGALYNSSVTGSMRYHFLTTPANCKYIRVCWMADGRCGLQKVPSTYDVVDLGDSIFGVNGACYDISSIAQEKTGFNFANCGFGGSQASSYPSTTSPYYSFNLWKLADAIYAEDFSEQETSAQAIEQTDGSILYVQRLTILESVDFSKVRLITIAYGTNDASKNVELDNENDKYDKTTFCGALRYSIEKLYSKYPNINIALMSAPYGRKGTNNEVSTDTWINGLSLHLMDYVNAMKSVAEEYHVPFYDHYTNMGVNDYNWQTYLRDGTHLTYIGGANLFGARVGDEVNSLLSDYK